MNKYKEALLNPISGPLVGIPNTVPVDTHRCYLKAARTITVSGGVLTVLANPFAALCNNAVPDSVSTAGIGMGAFNWAASTSMAGTSNVDIAYSNSQYSRAQFAALTNASSVRGRVVGACIRICNVSAANTRNGVFTLFQDPQHNTLQSKTAAAISTDQKARQFNASTPDWHTVTYHPVEPDEVDGWVWDPMVGPQAGVKASSYHTGTGGDGAANDNMPGFMGIWWNGDAVSQTFQVEMYLIAEYVGSLVQPLVRDIGSSTDDLKDAHAAAEASTVHVTDSTSGATHTGHPLSDLVHSVQHAWEKIPRPIKDAGKFVAREYIRGKLPKITIAKGAKATAMTLAPEFAPEIAATGLVAARAAPYAKALYKAGRTLARDRAMARSRGLTGAAGAARRRGY